MKLYFEILKLFCNRYLRRQSMGEAVRKFAERMGLAYIKLAQILATQNYGNIFTEQDRQILSQICDDCNPIEFIQIEQILRQEYGDDLSIFQEIDPVLVGAASISQVHRAVLKTGEVVAIKVKRRDVTQALEDDIARIRRLIKRFGKLAHLTNLIGTNYALDLYTKWIYEEADFVHERHNIETYTRFAESVNGKIKGAKQIKVPKVYTDLCTDNVIVMEFIESKTINQLELTTENRERIVMAMNSYIQNSFYALLHGQIVVFHGDPHGGNIYLDAENNIGFLDMGLIFELTESERKMVLEFFLCAYTGDAERLLGMLKSYTSMSEKKWQKFAAATREFCESIREKEITYYFMDMVNVCADYDIVPPTFLFAMAKAFVCLNGISGFSHNHTVGHALLRKQVAEFMIERSLNDGRELLTQGAKLGLKLVEKVLEEGMAGGIVEELKNTKTLTRDARSALDHAEEAWKILKEFIAE